MATLINGLESLPTGPLFLILAAGTESLLFAQTMPAAGLYITQRQRRLIANDSNDIAVSGYSNIEEYLNYLVLKHDNFPADLNNDEVVDNLDFSKFADDWLEDACGNYSLNNLNEVDCDVDMDDLDLLTQDWLEDY